MYVPTYICTYLNSTQIIIELFFFLTLQMSMSNNGKQTSPTALLMSGGRAKNLRKAPMERHYSDLSWRISALTTSNQIPPHKSESSQCVNQLSHSRLKTKNFCQN